MAITTNFDRGTGLLTVTGDEHKNSITIGRDAVGHLKLNGHFIHGQPTVDNTTLIQVFGGDGNDTIAVDQSNALPAFVAQPNAQPGVLPDIELHGGAGNDTLIGSAYQDKLFGDDGSDTLNGGGGNDVLHGGAGNDVLTGGIGNDQVFGDAGNDMMIWNTGDGSDLFEGGDGVDTLQVNGGHSSETYTITANGARVSLNGTGAETFSLDIGTTEKLVLNAGGADDVITAGPGLSSLISLKIDGGAGNDTITGGDGNDMLIGGDGNDVITGGKGNDTAFLGTGDDTFIWNNGDGSDTVEGQGGFDTLIFNGAAIQERITISANGDHAILARDLGGVTMDMHGIEQINVAPLGGPDTIIVGDLTGTGVRQVAIDLAAVPGTTTGDGQADIVSVSGTNGGDHITVTGSGSAIQVNGVPALVAITGVEAGNDVLNVHGQGGDDMIDASGLTAQIALTLDGGDGNDVIHGADFACNLIGGAGNDTIIGGAGDAHISGNDGDDIITGGGGQNVVDGGSGNDQITTFGGRDFLQGGAGNDVIHAGAGDDFVEGDSGNDTQFGEAGDDTFVWNPGDGSDTDDGGAGTDTLVFNGSSTADEQIAISANGTHVSLTRDVGSVAMDLNNFEHLVVNASGGADTITVNDLTGTGVLKTDIDLGAGVGGTGGDGANDTVVINGTAGNDTITLSIVNGALLIDGLAGRITVAHFDANDTIEINGLGGDDVFDTTGIGPNGPKIVIDGGDGDDTLTGAATSVVNVEHINSGFHLV